MSTKEETRTSTYDEFYGPHSKKSLPVVPLIVAAVVLVLFVLLGYYVWQQQNTSVTRDTWDGIRFVNSVIREIPVDEEDSLYFLPYSYNGNSLFIESHVVGQNTRKALVALRHGSLNFTTYIADLGTRIPIGVSANGIILQDLTLSPPDAQGKRTTQKLVITVFNPSTKTERTLLSRGPGYLHAQSVDNKLILLKSDCLSECGHLFVVWDEVRGLEQEIPGVIGQPQAHGDVIVWQHVQGNEVFLQERDGIMTLTRKSQVRHDDNGHNLFTYTKNYIVHDVDDVRRVSTFGDDELYWTPPEFYTIFATDYENDRIVVLHEEAGALNLSMLDLRSKTERPVVRIDSSLRFVDAALSGDMFFVVIGDDKSKPRRFVGTLKDLPARQSGRSGAATPEPVLVSQYADCDTSTLQWARDECYSQQGVRTRNLSVCVKAKNESAAIRCYLAM
mgnify:FL=1